MRVRGPSLLGLVRRSDSFANLVAGQIQQIMLSIAVEFGEDSTTDDLSEINAAWIEAVSEHLAEVVQESYSDAAGEIVNQVRHVLNLRHPDVDLDAFRVADPVAELYLQEAINRLRGIGNELWEHARAQLLEGFKLGESIGQLRDRLTATTELARPRAEVIARTEVVGASNAGAYDQMKATGLKSTKEWLASPGPRTRPSHARVNGTVAALDEKFTVGGWPCERPHDPALPPGESINCRCTLAYDVLDEGEEPVTEQLVEAPEVVEPTGPTLDALIAEPNRRRRNSMANDVFKFKADSGLRAQVSTTSRTKDGGLFIKGYVYDGREDVGEFQRYLRRDGDGNWYVDHYFFALDHDRRGQGFAKQWNDAVFEQYRKLDVPYVRLLANIDVGGYAWARQGFDWHDAIGPRNVIADVRETLVLHRGRYTDAQVDAANALIDRMESIPFGDKDFPTPYEVSMAGWVEGQYSWPGKDGMLGSRWEGIKWL